MGDALKINNLVGSILRKNVTYNYINKQVIEVS